MNGQKITIGFLSLLGRLYSLRKHFYYKNPPDNGRPDRTIIDVIGPPGVGKTTIIKHLLKNGIIGRKRIPVLGLHELCNLNDPLFASHPKLIFQKEKSNYKNARKLHGLQKKLNILFSDIYLKEKNTTNKVLLVDEGVGHHFTSKLIALSDSDPDTFNSIMSYRAFVFLSASPEIITERVVERRDSVGKIIPAHKNMEADALFLHSKKTLALRRELYQKTQSAGVPCIEINTELGVSESAALLKQFIRDLIKD